MLQYKGNHYIGGFMPDTLDNRGSSYIDHSTPSMQGSPDGKYIVIGPLTLEGLGKTDYWKNLQTSQNRALVLNKLGFEAAANQEHPDGMALIKKRHHKDRLFIL